MSSLGENWPGFPVVMASLRGLNAKVTTTVSRTLTDSSLSLPELRGLAAGLWHSAHVSLCSFLAPGQIQSLKNPLLAL